MSTRGSLARLLVPVLALSLGVARLAAQEPAAAGPKTNVVMEANPAVFTLMAALTVAGYDYGLSADTPAAALRRQLRDKLLAKGDLPVYASLRTYYAGHHLGDPSQDIDQYLTLALFLSSPPDIHLTLQAAALPENAADVSDIVPYLNEFYHQANLGALWDELQPRYDAALARDEDQVRQATSDIDAFLRVAQTYRGQQIFIYPDAMVSSLQTAPRNFEDNYYIIVNLDLGEQLAHIRHTYLHFVLEPLIGSFPAAIDQTEPLLKLAAAAPDLDPGVKSSVDRFYTECLVRAIEIAMQGGTMAQQQSAAEAAMNQGLLLTGFWVQQLAAFRADVVSFTEFYKNTAFEIRVDELAAQNKHRAFTAATPGDAAPAAADVARVASPLEQANALFDAGATAADPAARGKDFDDAEGIARAELDRPGGNPAEAWYLLGKLASERKKPQEAATDFSSALRLAPPANAHLHTWCNIYLARLSDAEGDRAQAIKYYQQALATADTPLSRQSAIDGIKTPFTGH